MLLRAVIVTVAIMVQSLLLLPLHALLVIVPVPLAIKLIYVLHV